MNHYRYIGSAPKLQSKTALGRTELNHRTGKVEFFVQVDQKPCTINRVKWAYGWHKTPAADWEKIK